MNRRKIYIIVAVLLVLAIVFIALNSGKKDTSRAQLDTIFTNTTTAGELSKEAAERGSVYQIKVVASDINATATSDTQELTTYYKGRFGKKPKLTSNSKNKSSPTAVLKGTEGGADFDKKYKELITELLKNNLQVMKDLTNSTNRTDLKAILEGPYSNQQTDLQQLANLP